MNRIEMIDWLVANDMDYIKDNDGGGLEYLEHILRSGFDGYDSMTDADLSNEVKQRKGG